MHGTMHVRISGEPKCKYLGLPSHSGTVVGKLEGEREVTLGFVDLMREGEHYKR